ncbi:hypothetical protein pb186bvf_001909 [Paramecium bursaria]
MADYVHQYELEQQQQHERKQRILQMTEQKMIENKLQNDGSGSKKEQQFNLRLQSLKSLGSFIDVRTRISKMNVLNDKVVDKYLRSKQVDVDEDGSQNVIFREIKRIIRQQQETGLDKRVDLQQQNQLARAWMRKRTMTLNPNIAGRGEVLNIEIPQNDSKYDTNYFYSNVFKQIKRDPNFIKNDRLQELRKRRKSNVQTNIESKVNDYLLKQGIATQDNSNCYNFINYYNKYNQQTENMVKNAKLEAKKKYLEKLNQKDDQFMLSEQTLKNLQINNELYKKYQLPLSHRVVRSISKTERTPQGRSLERTPDGKLKLIQNKTDFTTLAKKRITQSQHEESPIATIRQRVKSQVEGLQQNCINTAKIFNEKNQESKKILNKMISSVNKMSTKFKVEADDN